MEDKKSQEEVTVVRDGNIMEDNNTLSSNLKDESKAENDIINKKSEPVEGVDTSKEQVTDITNVVADEDKNVEPEEDEEWLDILGSGQLKKKVITKGESDSRPQRLDVCVIKYEGRLEDETLVEEADNKVINLGDAEVIQGLDFSLPLMDVGETAEIIVGPRFAYGTLGLAPKIPSNSTLHYKITLISTKPEPEFTSLSVQERKEIGNRKKERGNWWYSREEYTLAIQCYRRALDYLDDIESSAASEDIELNDKEVHNLLEERLKVYNNLAASQMKIKAFDTALQSVSKVLRCQPNNVKALFRKGKILSAKGETEEGIAVLKRALELEPDSPPVKNELAQLLARKRQDTAQQRDLYKKMLGTIKTEANKEAKQSSTSHLRWGLVAGSIAAAVAGAVVCKYKFF